jgi:hypothetical protein
MFCGRACAGKKSWQDKARIVPADPTDWLERDYRSLYAKSRANAKKRNILWNLTKPEFDGLVVRAKGRCEVSGLAFQGAHAHRANGRRPFAPSLDRIDSAGLYELKNCRLVAVITNTALNSWGDEPLHRLARALCALPEKHQSLTGDERQTYERRIKDAESTLLQAQHERDAFLVQSEVALYGKTREEIKFLPHRHARLISDLRKYRDEARTEPRRVRPARHEKAPKSR